MSSPKDLASRWTASTVEGEAAGANGRFLLPGGTPIEKVRSLPSGITTSGMLNNKRSSAFA